MPPRISSMLPVTPSGCLYSSRMVKKMSEGIAANNQKNIYCKNAKNKCQAATPAVVNTLFDDGEHNWPHRYGEVKT